eukprot:360643-Chlamydomonas_euryale.AAC.5
MCACACPPACLSAWTLKQGGCMEGWRVASWLHSGMDAAWRDGGMHAGCMCAHVRALLHV